MTSFDIVMMMSGDARDVAFQTVHSGVTVHTGARVTGVEKVHILRTKAYFPLIS